MINKNEISEILRNYDLENITVGVLGSHSALDICAGAKKAGFNTLVVCQKGREKTYDYYFKTNDEEGVVDETIILDKFSQITSPEIVKKLQEKNTIFIPHRSFEVYVGFDKIEKEFKVPLFGTRNLLRAEERDAERNQYYLMEKARIPFPKPYKNPKDIDQLVIVKVSEAERKYERAFFFASSYEEYEKKSKQMLEAGKITQEGLENAVIEEFILGTQVNFNYFYSPLDDKLELLGTDTRRQTNLDGILHLPAPQQLDVLKYLGIKTIEAGHIACTVKESLLEQIFELGEKFVKVTQEEYPPGIIGSFALQSSFKPGPPKEKAVVFDISLRVQGSPGTRFTPYSGYLHRRNISVGERTAQEIKKAVEESKLDKITT